MGVGVQGLARFVCTIAIGRATDPETLGETSAMLSLAVYLALFWPTASGIAAASILARPLRREASLTWLRRTTLLAVALSAALAFPVAGAITRDPFVAACTVPLVAGYGLYVFVRGAMLGLDRYRLATIVDGLSSAATLGLLVLVLLAGWSSLLLLPLAAGYLLFVAIGWPRLPREDATPEERRTLVLFVRDTTIGALATGGLLPATMVFVQTFDSPAAAGLFAAGLSLATPANLLSQALNQVLVPHFARLLSAGETEARRSHLRVALGSFLVFAGVFGVLMLIAPWMLSLFYGERYVDGAPPTAALLAVVFAISCTSAPAAYLLVSGRQRIYSRIWFVAFLVGTAVMVTTSPAWGMWGALLGFAIGGGGGSIAIVVAGFASARTQASAEDVMRSNTER